MNPPALQTQQALAQAIKPVRTYECWVPAWEGTELGHRISYTRHTAAQAKNAFFEMLRDVDYQVNWIDIRVRSLRKVVENSAVRSIAEYRNVPFVYTGMAAQLSDQIVGRIVNGGGGGAYFQLLADDGQLHWFHPQGDRVRWLNDDGTDFEVAA